MLVVLMVVVFGVRGRCAGRPVMESLAGCVGGRDPWGERALRRSAMARTRRGCLLMWSCVAGSWAVLLTSELVKNEGPECRGEAWIDDGWKSAKVTT
jgi:hypothetical protein